MARYLVLMGALLLLLTTGCGVQQRPAANAAPVDPTQIKGSADSPSVSETAGATAGTAPDTAGDAQNADADADQSPASIAQRTKGMDWPVFLGPTGDNKSTESGILTKWPKGGPRLVWQLESGEGYGIGSVSRGRYFHFDRVGDQARLLCLNAETGAQLWKFNYETDYVDLFNYSSGPRCTPVVDGDRVYILGGEGILHCVRVTDGKMLWKLDTSKEFGVVQNFFGVGSTPVVEGDLLILMVGGSPPDSQDVAPGQLDRVEGNGSGVVALDKRTGKVRYQLSDELAGYAAPKLATINDRRWCFVFARGGLLGFDPETGKLDFHYPWRARILESVNASTPVVVGDEVFISETYGPGSSLLKVRPGGHEVVWKDNDRRRQKAMQTHWNTSIHVDGHLYGSSGRHTAGAELRCIEWKSGKVAWSQPGLSRTSLLYVDGHFLSLGEYGDLVLFKANPDKFEPVAQAMLGDPEGGRGPLLDYPCWAAPVLSHGLLYLRGRDSVVCLELMPAASK